MSSQESGPGTLAIQGGTPAKKRPDPPMFPGAMLIDEEEEQSVLQVLRSKRLFRYYGPQPGPSKVEELEDAFANCMGTQYALAVSSGTAALICGLQGIGVGPGDEVIVPAYAWIASAASVLAAGAVPVVAEVDQSLTLDPADVERKITPHTKAIMAVHMRGAPCRMDELLTIAQNHGLKVIEDTAQSNGGSYKGQRLGSIGDVGCFSLQFRKIITSGEGGMVITDDEQSWKRAFMFHDVIGGLRRNLSVDEILWGINFRMPELLAAVAVVQLGRLEGNPLHEDVMEMVDRLGVWPDGPFAASIDVVLNPDDSSVEVVSAKESIRDYGKVAEIFSRQRPEGYWEAAEQPYLPKYKSTYWQVMILSQLDLDRSDERVRKACEYIYQFQLAEGGFSLFRREGAKMEYRLVEERMLKRGKEPQPFETWCEGKIREYEMSCLTGNVAASLIKLGYAEDERVRKALKWLVDIQNADGGWLCPYWKAHIKDKHGCFMGTITPLDAFSEVPTELRTTEMMTAIKRGVEFLLMHRLFKADHHGFKTIKKNWLNLGFPWFFYDILRGLSVVTKLGYTQDERLNDALEILVQKQNAEGKWILENTPSGRMQTNLEQKGKPSKWITLHALRVLKRIYQDP